MILHREAINVRSQVHRPTFFTITEQVQQIVERSGAKDGICVVCSHHTTCSVLIQESSFDMAYSGLEFIQQDLVDVLETLIPSCRREGQYMHPGPEMTAIAEKNGESREWCLNTDAHLRSVLIGRSESVVIVDGQLDLGSFGQIFFVDFDQTRERDRQIQVQIVGE